jgi:hypothetical protein
MWAQFAQGIRRADSLPTPIYPTGHRQGASYVMQGFTVTDNIVSLI